MKNILIVDDELLIRYSLEAALKRVGWTVTTAANGSEALKAIGSSFFEFCFLDIYLPDMSGLDIMRTVKTKHPATKIIMMTGSEVDEDIMKDIRENAFLFLAKPFDLFVVKRIINLVSLSDDNTYQDIEAMKSRMSAERRQQGRKGITQQITYEIKPRDQEKQEQLAADLLDISDKGTCIRTEYPLKPGKRVKFGSSLKDREGIVRWSRPVEGHAYRAGIQFVM